MLDTAQLIRRGKREDAIFNILGILFTLLGIVTLGILVVDLLIDGMPRLNAQFMTTFPSRNAGRAGILSAWVGTLMVIAVTMCTAVPVGVAAAVYLEEYAPKNWVTTLIEINISNLAGVPSIIYGLMALGLLVYQFHLGRTVLVGGLTLALLVLPIVIVSTREAIRAIPSAIREAAYAAGATKWQVIRYHLIPYSMGGIATGTIIAMSRAIGETAPLVTIGALSYVAFTPSWWDFLTGRWLNSGFTALPIQMYIWVSRPQASFHQNAAATGLVLIVFTLAINGVAMYLRYRIRKNLKW